MKFDIPEKHINGVIKEANWILWSGVQRAAMTWRYKLKRGLDSMMIAFKAMDA